MKYAEEVNPQKENNYWLPGITGREEWSDENILEDSGDGRMTLNILKSTELYPLKYDMWIVFQKKKNHGWAKGRPKHKNSTHGKTHQLDKLHRHPWRNQLILGGHCSTQDPVWQTTCYLTYSSGGKESKGTYYKEIKAVQLLCHIESSFTLFPCSILLTDKKLVIEHCNQMKSPNIKINPETAYI